MVPQVGDIVLVIVDPAVNNGSDVAPGVLTNVFNTVAQETSDWGPYYRVNAKAFLDSEGADQRLTSAALYLSEDTARACQQANPHSRVVFPKTAEVR